jgi:uncharacterized protein
MENHMSAVSTDFLSGPVAPTARDRVRLSPLGLADVSLSESGMLGAWQQVNRANTIRHCIEQLEPSGALPNMRRVTGENTADFVGMLFSDSDIYKTLEAIGWEAARSDVSEFLPFVDATVDLLTRAQDSDGYLNSYFQTVKVDERFQNLRWGHELYCLGHLLQAGVAWARTVGRTDILEIGLRMADLVIDVLGPEGRNGVCGHPEIETALVEVYRVTGERKYLDLAQRMIDLRGDRLVGHDRFGYPYFQDHEPVREVTEATGHAVRQLYLTAGEADAYVENGDDELLEALERVWRSVHEQKMYITGGLGSRHRDESFGDAFELPPDRAYSETCAAIANFMWNWRMLLIQGESRFADEMERGLYNAIAVSTDIDGDAFFYSNPLQLRTGHGSDDEDSPSSRLTWYTCACCPPNLARLVSSLQHYVATTTADGLQLHLYAAGDVRLTDGSSAHVSTDYPWDGAIGIDFDRPFAGELRLRVPAWSTGFTVTVNGAPVEPRVEAGYAVLPAGSDLSLVTLVLDMPPVAHRPHPYLDASRGCVAVSRGPVVYCVEQADLGSGLLVEDVLVPANPTLELGPVDEALGAPSILVADGARRPAPGRNPYPIAAGAADAPAEPLAIPTIPYFRWANRSEGGMRVWLPTT